MKYVVMEDAVTTKVDAVRLKGLQFACSAHSVDCSFSAVVAVPPAVSMNVDAVPMQWMQCQRR